MNIVVFIYFFVKGMDINAWLTLLWNQQYQYRIRFNGYIIMSNKGDFCLLYSQVGF